jgi:transaldolase
MTAQQDTLAQLTEMGVSIWLDDISRERLSTGNLASLIRDMDVRGVTSNPTIFAKALASGSAYAEQVADLAVRGVTVYDATKGLDGRVSLEVDPRLARDTAKTIAEARALWWMVDRPNLFIKIPATLEGLPAITQCLSEGISINVTLIFSLERYAQVIDAYMAGLEAASGRDAASIASVASFFVSRVDTEVDERLDKIGTHEARTLRGTAALANARLAYELFEQRFAETAPRWAALRARGARVQRPLWASTSVKDPSFAATMYVTELVAPHTVNTMPESTMHATAAGDGLHGYTIQGTYDASREVWRQLDELGVHYDDVVKVLEEQGVDKFKASWVELLETIGREMAAGGTTT